MFTTRKLWVISALVAFALMGAASAQERFPSRPIKLVVALGPGSGVDSLARMLSDYLRDDLKTELIVENKPGAAGVLGGDFLAKSKPDGYTLGVFHASVLTTAAAINSNLPYDPLKAFTPLALVGTNPLALVVSAASRWNTLGELLEDARKNPGKISCGIIGMGSHSHFNLELLRIDSGAEITRVPYSAGTGAVIVGILGGHVDCTSLTWPAVLGQVRGGKLRALAVTSRIKEFPRIPTFAESGFPRASLEVFYAIFGPANLPREVVGRLVPALEKAIRDPKNEASLEKMGYSVSYEGPAKLSDRIANELAVVREVAAKVGVKQD